MLGGRGWSWRTCREVSDRHATAAFWRSSCCVGLTGFFASLRDVRGFFERDGRSGVAGTGLSGEETRGLYRLFSDMAVDVCILIDN